MPPARRWRVLAAVAPAAAAASSGVDVPVVDCHVHSFMDWARINYTYQPGTIFHYNWTQEDYLKATTPSALPPSSHVYMSLIGVPSGEWLALDRVASEQAAAAGGGGVPMRGIVSNGDPSDPGFAAFLDELRAAVPLVRGVRALAPPAPYPDSFVAGLRELAARNLTYDVFLSHRQEQLAEVHALAEAVPGLTIVVEHMGLTPVPGNAVPDFAWWSSVMDRLASYPNVVVKVSGGGAPPPADGVAAMRPLVAHLARTFGYERCVYSGNWYVADAQDGFLSYRAWAAAVAGYLAELNATQDERRWLLGGACERAYRL